MLQPSLGEPAIGSSSDTVLLVGQAPLPTTLRPFSALRFLSLEIEVNCDTERVQNALCRDLSPSVEATLRETLLGKQFETALEACTTTIRKRYFASTRDALLQALESARQQYLQWKQDIDPTLPELSPPYRPTALASAWKEPVDPRPVRTRSRHELVTLLVTLLAHSRLLDRRPGRNKPGRPVAPDVRRQAIQAYALIQQLLHSIQAEPGLLQPYIEKVPLPGLLQRVLNRTEAVLQKVQVQQRLPANLPAARGDALVLEEALVLLFEEIAYFAGWNQSGITVIAERRRSDILLTLGLQAQEVHEGATEAEEGTPNGHSNPIARMWGSGLGTLAARSLVEHQGGRLWMQDSFPEAQNSLCLSLPIHHPREGTAQS